MVSLANGGRHFQFFYFDYFFYFTFICCQSVLYYYYFFSSFSVVVDIVIGFALDFLCNHPLAQINSLNLFYGFEHNNFGFLISALFFFGAAGEKFSIWK